MLDQLLALPCSAVVVVVGVVMLDEELLNNSGSSIETSKPLARKSQDLFYCRELLASPGNGAGCPN